MQPITRRSLLASSSTYLAALALSGKAATAATIRGVLPVVPDKVPTPVRLGGWSFFSPAEGATMEALVDRLIPPDPETPGGKDCGCAVFIDRQLAGPYGHAEGQYLAGPFQKGAKSQGPQSELTPAGQYREALAALDRHCRAHFNNAAFVQLSDQQKDALLEGLEKGEVKLEGAVEGTDFFTFLLRDTKEGFFADPIYGGNRNLAAWKMIGFPGARYDYRDWVDKHNQRFPLPPVGMAQHPDWPE